MILDASIRTISCDGTGCDKTVTFDQKEAEITTKNNPWLTSVRITQTADGRVFVHCSDACLLSSTGEGKLNPVEKKKIVEAPNANAIRMAAEAAQRQTDANKALKSGAPIQIAQS